MSSGIIGNNAIGSFVIGSPDPYVLSGTVESPVLTIDHTNDGIFSWDGKRNLGTIIAEYALSNDGINFGPWTAISNGRKLPAANYLKYRFTLTRSADEFTTPELKEVRITYPLEYFDSGTWVSPVLDLRGIVAASSSISWAVTVPPGTSVKVETRSGKDPNTMGEWKEVTTSGSAIPSTDWYVQCRITLSTKAGTKDITPSADRIAMSVTAKTDEVHGIWYSPTLDATTARDKASGHVSLEVKVNGGRVEVWSRSSADGNAWSDWYPATNEQLSHPPNNYVQVAAEVVKDAELQLLQVSFDGQPEATLLANDFSEGGQFYFATLLDKIVIVNGIDAPRKYDGETISLLGGSPPRGAYVAAHKNRLWMAGDQANPSRLYYSDILNIESWPALNFIDISPNDGDKITGLLTIGDYLIISKGHSMWMLTGEGSSTFSVRRIHSDRGAYAPRSLILVDGALCFVSDDGIYMSDFTQHVLISERIRKFWNSLNLRRLHQAASWYYDHKLFVAVPSGGSIQNDTVIVFDALRKSFAGIYTGWNVSCWQNIREGGKIETLFGHSNQTQVSQLTNTYSDNGKPIMFVWKSKDFDFNSPETYKRLNRIFAELNPPNLPAQLTLTFYIDGNEVGSMTVDVPPSQSDLVHTARILASKAGVVGGRKVSFKIEQAVVDNPVGIHMISIEHMIKGVQPSFYA
ncbi:hypothetical protein BSNK01_11840 [Bacillaceae bacterium]